MSTHAEDLLPSPANDVAPGQAPHEGEFAPASAAAASPRLTPPSPWLVYAAASLLAPLAWALYHRITRSRALEHEARQRMLLLVRERPGILIADAARALGITYHPASHHARILQRYGHLDLVQVGRNIAIYPAGTVPLRHRGPMVNLRRGPQAETLRVLQVRPGLTPSDLAAQLGCARSTAHASLRRLLRQDLVRKEAGGYHITDHGVEALDVAARWGAREAEAVSHASLSAGPPDLGAARTTRGAPAAPCAGNLP